MFEKVKQFFNKSPTVSTIEMITEQGNGFYAWNGNLYHSDLVRSCIRPKVKAIGKLTAKHVRQTGSDFQVNPEVYMRFLLEEPNPYMTGQMLQEKLATQLQLNNNAFAYIVRDGSEMPVAIYPIPATTVEAVYNKAGDLFLRCFLLNGKLVTFPYVDVIHLRQDFNTNDIFGEIPQQALAPLMEIVNTTDQGIIKAIKNSAVVKWLLKFNTTLRPEDLKKETDQFTNTFLSIENSGGAASTDAKMDAIQVTPHDYVPNALQMDKTTQRIFSFFGTNEKIIQSRYNEDEWNAYYEAEIEPFALQASGEFTRKLFSRKQRGFGNSIMFESSNLQYASMSTKLALYQAVDRGSMTPNEWRKILGNLTPLPGGDEAIRRLDTQPVKEYTKVESGGE